MTSKKDMRREDLAIPYMEPEKEKDQNDMSATLGQTMPMAAMFTRNKMIAWVSLIFTLQSWLAETPEQRRTGGTPGYFSVLMSVLALAVFFLPPVPPSRGGTSTSTSTGVNQPVPPAH